jgi:hypothetical protein
MTNFYYCRTVADLLTWGALSDERTGLSLQLLPVLASAVILGSVLIRCRGNVCSFRSNGQVFTRLSAAADRCLASRCLAMDVSAMLL